MKHAMLKFNHAVEIGARLAYIGHHKRTGDETLLQIIADEADHRYTLEQILKDYDDVPYEPLNKLFWLMGKTVGFACLISPRWALNFVARSLEFIAIFNYGYLAIVYPRFEATFKVMARAEKRHQEYFEEIA